MTTLAQQIENAKQWIGFPVQSDDSDICGELKYVTADGWAGVLGLPEGKGGKGPRRMDEIQVGRIYPDPT